MRTNAEEYIGELEVQARVQELVTARRIADDQQRAAQPVPTPSAVVAPAVAAAPRASDRPAYKKWWVWTIAAVAAVGIGVGVGVGVSSGHAKERSLGLVSYP